MILPTSHVDLIRSRFLINCGSDGLCQRMPEQRKNDSQRGEQCSECGKEHADLRCLVLHNEIRW